MRLPPEASVVEHVSDDPPQEQETVFGHWRFGGTDDYFQYAPGGPKYLCVWDVTEWRSVRCGFIISGCLNTFSLSQAQIRNGVQS